MNIKDKLLNLFSKMSFTCLVVAWLLTAAGALTVLWAILSSVIALDSPILEIGKENAIPIIGAIEAYKADHHVYPQDLHDTIKYNPDALDHLHDYEYELYTGYGSTQQFILSFRVRWTIDNWYCYYSEDQEWLQSDPTCRSDPRPIHEANK